MLEWIGWFFTEAFEQNSWLKALLICLVLPAVVGGVVVLVLWLT